MNPFPYQQGRAYCEGVPLERVAREFGTPCYVYSLGALRHRARELKRAFQGMPTLPCYAVKANGNLSVLRTIFAEDFGADVVSVGEMKRALAGGAKGAEIVFSGVGKTREEMDFALATGILSFNVESMEELSNLAARAKALGKVAPISLRMNPNIDAKTNPYIATGLHSTKFGIAENDLTAALERIRREPSLALKGLDCHIGSQITELGPFAEAAERMAQLTATLRTQGFQPEWVDMGGGLGIRYHQEEPPSVEAYAQTLLKHLAPLNLKLVLEPGRWLVGNAGVVVTRVVGTKRTPLKKFLIVDAAMNDLARPSLYGAYHGIRHEQERKAGPEKGDVVGPICESGDFLAKDRPLPDAAAGDLLIVDSCGAYGSSMASTYNCRPVAAEVVVEGTEYRLARPRQPVETLWAAELELL